MEIIISINMIYMSAHELLEHVAFLNVGLMIIPLLK